MCVYMCVCAHRQAYVGRYKHYTLLNALLGFTNNHSTGYHAAHQVVLWFWQVAEMFDNE